MEREKPLHSCGLFVMYEDYCIDEWPCEQALSRRKLVSAKQSGFLHHMQFEMRFRFLIEIKSNTGNSQQNQIHLLVC